MRNTKTPPLDPAKYAMPMRDGHYIGLQLHGRTFGKGQTNTQRMLSMWVTNRPQPWFARHA